LESNRSRILVVTTAKVHVCVKTLTVHPRGHYVKYLSVKLMKLNY